MLFEKVDILFVQNSSENKVLFSNWIIAKVEFDCSAVWID